MVHTGSQARFSAADRRFQGFTRCLALSGQHALYASVERAGRTETARVVLADLASGRVHAAFRRRRIAAEPRPAAGSASTVSAAAEDLAVSFKAGQGRREAFGHAYGFGSADGPLLFDVVMEQAQGGALPVDSSPARGSAPTPDSGIAAGLRAEGRVLSGKREYLYSPAASLGAMESVGGLEPKEGRVTRLDAAGWASGEAVWLHLRTNAEDLEGKAGNALLRAGKPLAIGAVSFRPERQSDAEGTAPWRIQDGTGRLSLTFKPALETRERAGIFCRRPSCRLLFGAVSGTIVPESGEPLSVSLPMGCLEIR